MGDGDEYSSLTLLYDLSLFLIILLLSHVFFSIRTKDANGAAVVESLRRAKFKFPGFVFDLF